MEDLLFYGNLAAGMDLLHKEERNMAIMGIICAIVLLCIIAGLWATGAMNSRRFNFRGRNTSEHHEPGPRTPGLD